MGHADVSVLSRGTGRRVSLATADGAHCRRSCADGSCRSLPWAAKSALRTWNKALREVNGGEAAQGMLSATERSPLRRNVRPVWAQRIPRRRNRAGFIADAKLGPPPEGNSGGGILHQRWRATGQPMRPPPCFVIATTAGRTGIASSKSGQRVERSS